MTATGTLALLPLGAAARAPWPRAVAAPGAEILWDTYGVPHIYAQNRKALARAFGWAQMTNHGDLLLRLVAQARGRGAEYLGPRYLDEDRWVWTLGFPDRARQWVSMQDPATREHVEAFADGINAFARAHPEQIGDSVRAVLPVTSADIFAHSQRVLYSAFLNGGREGTQGQARRWAGVGSNAWAIAPKRTTGGHTLFLANPHLPWTDLFTWTEVQYVAPGVNVYGAALVLSPVIQIGFNDDLAWTHTVNTQDGVDLYALTLADGGYLWDGAVRSFETSVHVLKVKQPDGALTDDTVRVRRSIHGPIVGEKAGKALAYRAVGLAGPALPYINAQWWAMGNAHTLREFLAAIRPNQISGQNITYGDRAGHIMMFYGGNTPLRSRGDLAYWSGIVPGDSSSTLWTTLVPFDSLPRITDPPSGWVQNANDPPWWATFPLAISPASFPSYFGPKPMALRPQRSARMLAEDSAMTFDKLLAYKHSTRMELADRVLDELIAAVRANGDATLGRAADVLAAWDRSADATSRGAVLFTQWWQAYTRQLTAGRSRWREEWSEAAPRTTPAGLGDVPAALTALGTAAKTVADRWGSIEVPWGDVYRLRRDGVDLPSNGASGAYGVFRVQDYSEGKDHRFEAGTGDSYVAAIEFTSPLRARTIVGSGNASRPGSPHRTDQLPLFARKELKPAWRTRAEVEAHLERRERP